MGLDRRHFLKGVALAASGAALPLGNAEAGVVPEIVDPAALSADWGAVRRLFALSPEAIDMSAMLIASHPRPVRAAIARYRDALDAAPVTYLERNNDRLTNDVISEAARYFHTSPRAIALTDSTTQGVGLVYSGLRLRRGQEVLTTEKDYFVTHESLRLAAERSGARLRRIPLYEDIETVSPGGLAAAILRAVTPATRLVALTWVHSSTGLKLPIAQIADGLARINAQRPEGREVLLSVDGVHGFGIEDVTFEELGCDFLVAGCHKWLFGPRGTGIVVATERGYQASLPIVPSFIDGGVFNAWLRGDSPDSVSDGATMSPGGFKSFEHRWALADAFRLHQTIGKRRIMERTRELALHLKTGLKQLPGVRLVTPLSPDLSAGIVSFDVEGYSAHNAVRALRGQGIIASAAPYATPHVRLTPSIRNSHEDVEAALAAVASLD